jgi:hypothetical protein
MGRLSVPGGAPPEHDDRFHAPPGSPRIAQHILHFRIPPPLPWAVELHCLVAARSVRANLVGIRIAGPPRGASMLRTAPSTRVRRRLSPFRISGASALSAASVGWPTCRRTPRAPRRPRIGEPGALGAATKGAWR